MDPFFRRIQQSEPVSFQECVDAFAHRVPLLHSLSDTPQDSIWHAEGDVETHTKMVLDEVYRILDSPPFPCSSRDRLLLVLAAVFHDIAKPLVTQTREIDGQDRIVAPRHAWRGRSILASQLSGVDLPEPILLELLQLVGYHHDPKFLLIREKPKHAFLALSRASSCRLLYLLELADMRGRVCPDQDEQVEWIEMFRLYCEEYNIFHTPEHLSVWREEVDRGLADFSNRVRAYAYLQGLRDLESGVISHPSEAVARGYNAAKRGVPHVVVCCGLSATGKSTWVRHHTTFSKYVYISLDEIREELTGDASNQSMNSRVHNVARERLKQALRERRDVVWDATNLRQDFRSNVLTTSHDYGAFTTLAVFRASVQTVRTRNSSRSRVVPPHVLSRQIETFQWPVLSECHELVYVLEDGTVQPYSDRYSIVSSEVW